MARFDRLPLRGSNVGMDFVRSPNGSPVRRGSMLGGGALEGICGVVGPAAEGRLRGG